MAKRKSKFADRLADMNDSYNEQKDLASGIPDGEYLFQLQSAEFGESSNGNMMVRWEHLLIEGEHEGFVARDNSMIMDGRQMYFLAKRIRDLGGEPPEDLTDLEEVVQELVEAAPTYTARIKNDASSGFLNINILELTDEPASVPNEDDDTDADADADPEEEEEEEEEEEDDSDSEEEEEEEEEDETFEVAKELAIAQGYGIDDDTTLEDIVETFKDEKWNADELTKDELKLLDDLGIKVTKPKPAAKKKAPAKKKATTKKKKTSRRKK